MITRYYFFCARKDCNDDSGRTTWVTGISSYMSVFPDHSSALNRAKDDIDEIFKNDPGDDITIISFNRL